MSRKNPCRKGQVGIVVCLPEDLYRFYKALPKSMRAEIHRAIRRKLAELKARYEVEYVRSYRPTEE